MAAHVLGGDLLEPLGHLGHRLKEVAEQQTLRKAAQLGAGRQARIVGVAHHDLGNAARGGTPGEGRASEHADALAAAGQQLGKRKRQHHRPAFLGDLGERGAEPHRRREVGPQPDGMGGLPFALAHEQMVGACRAAPIDAGARVVLIEMAELPEGFAGTRAPPAVRAVGDSVGHALRLDEERRHAGRQPMGLGFLARKWLKRFLPRGGQAHITPAARPASPPCGSCRRPRRERRR